MRAAAFLAFAVALALSPSLGNAQARDFRAFAVAYKHELAAVQDYASYAAVIRAQYETEIAPQLRADAPNLVVYPENQTLMAYMLGQRGALARQILDDAGSTAALVSLGSTYSPQISYYQAKFPGTESAGQLLQLALTDTLARLVMEVFAPLAAEHGVYLSITSNLAPFERVTGPQVQTLKDPQLDVDYAYEATEAPIYNRNFIFGPDGTLLTVQDKAYLVPIERDQQTGLGLTGIETAALPVFDLPFGRIATVISKDAWMIDVNERLDQLGAEILLQPEAFSTWGVSGGDLWPPDKFQRGGWWMLQQHPAPRINITPMLTGNFGDLSFDGQPLIAVEGPQGADNLCLMGQSPEPGWAAVGGWANLSQPAEQLCAPAQRPMLAELGAAIAPGSGDARENAYAHTVTWADLSLPAVAAPTARLPASATSSQLVTDTGGSQLQPALSTTAEGAALAWIDSFGEPNQNLALAHWNTADGWSEVQRPAPTEPTAFDHFDNHWSPSLLTDAQGLLLGFLAFPTENWDVFALRIPADGNVTEPLRVDDAEAEGGTQRERGHSRPLLLHDAEHQRHFMIWSDLRWPWIKPQIRIAISTDGGNNWSASRRADGGPITGEAEQLDARDPGESRGQAMPSAHTLTDGRLLVAWQEPRDDGTPGIRTAIWNPEDGNAEFIAIPAAGLGAEFAPKLLTDGEHFWLISELRDSAGGRQLQLRRLLPDAQWSPQQALDPSAALGHVQRHASLLLLDGRPTAIYSDNRAGDSDLLLIRLGDTGPIRLDDAAPGVDSHSPTAITTAAGELLLVWQQESDAGPQLRSSYFERVPVAPAASPAPSPRRGGGGALSLTLILAALLAAVRRPQAARRRR